MNATPFTLDRLEINQLRNLDRVVLEPASRVNVITGQNGQGKTSILEAIYLLATTRSFRTPRLAEVRQHESPIGSVRGRFRERGDDPPLAREQSVGVKGSRRTAKLNGEDPSSLSDYATRSPVVVFEPRQLTLSTGPALGRRTLLDRITLFTHPAIATHRSRYNQGLRERQRLLADHGPGASAELDVYESLLSEHGAALTRARQAASERLTVALGHAFHEIAAPDLALTAKYAPGGSADPEACRREWRQGRERDSRSKRSHFGPQRDDLLFQMDGRSARVVASQGQHRAITLALKIAEVACIAEARGVQPILLLDDVSSELDPQRSEALFKHLATTTSQIFLTTTRRDLIVTAQLSSDRRDFFVHAGQVSEDAETNEKRSRSGLGADLVVGSEE